MTFEIRIQGHTPQNDEAKKVREVAIAATRALLGLEGSASLSGYAIDSQNNFTFSNQDVAEAIALELKANEPDEVVEAEAEAEVEPVQATVAAAKHAESLGVDLSQVGGTGKDGKVTKADIEAATLARPELVTNPTPDIDPTL